MQSIGKSFDIPPQICDPLMGGHTPILSMDELGEIGFNGAVLGLDTVMHAAKAIENVLLDMKSGESRCATRHELRGIQEGGGYDEWESVDERFAPKTPAWPPFETHRLRDGTQDEGGALGRAHTSTLW